MKHHLFTAHSLLIPCPCTADLLPIRLFTTDSSIHCLSTAYSAQPAHSLYTACTLPVHCLFTAYSLHTDCPRLFTAYSDLLFTASPMYSTTSAMMMKYLHNERTGPPHVTERDSNVIQKPAAWTTKCEKGRVVQITHHLSMHTVATITTTSHRLQGGYSFYHSQIILQCVRVVPDDGWKKVLQRWPPT
jgi:hypothetical protein